VRARLATARRQVVGSAVAITLFALRLTLLGTVMAVEAATGRGRRAPAAPR
jgi:hypothetical protein